MTPARSKYPMDRHVPNGLTQQGVGLIEVLIALVVFALGVVGMAGLQLRTMGISIDSQQRSYVVSKSQDIADRIRSNGIPAVNYLSGVNTYNEQFCINQEAVVSQCSDDVNADADAAACDAPNMSLFDLYDAFCVGEGSFTNQVTGSNQVTDWLVDISCEFPDPASGAMTATATCDEEGATIAVTTTWFARTAIDSTDAAGAATTETDSMTLRFVQ